MAETVQCATHGESQHTFVCSHLAEESHGLGFNRESPSDDDPFPDAWCDDCEVIRAAHGGWTDEAQALVKIKLVCSGCYERTQIRNTKTSVTLDDLSNLRWQCGTCDEWHAGPILDQSFDAPDYWSHGDDEASRWSILPSGAIEKACKSFLDSDYCAIDDENFFVRGVINLPIIGTAKNFCWGVWGSLSRESFESLLRHEEDPERTKLPAMFSWLSSQISDYPDTLNLKMYAHLQAAGMRPHFHLERSDHPLAREFHEGISPERVKEIMFRSLPDQPA